MEYNGVALDARSEEEKAGDWKDELFASGSYTWQTKPRETWKSYPIRNQNGSGMCGAFATCKALGINEKFENGTFENLNCAFIYNKRANNGSGMWMQDMFEIARLYGAPTDPTLSSDGINDEQASKIKFTDANIQEALKYRSKNYFIVSNNIDAIASIVDAGYTPILLMRCNFKEWTAEPFVDSTVSEADYNINHFIPVVDATMYNGKKCLVIEDSWGQQYGSKGVRILSEDFIKARVFAVGYMIDLKNEDMNKPMHHFGQTLVYGSSGAEVVAWQKVLQYEKLLATSTSNGTPLPLGKFLEMTASATKKWQVAHGIMDYANEKNLTKIRVGSKTIAAANKIYSA